MGLKQATITSALYEMTQRYGSAGSEYIKGLRGVDYETGRVFDRSLIKISQGKINPNFSEQNIKQQAGYSAEIVSVSKKNAQAIINGEPNRFFRSEDIAKYGKNHTVVDIVEIVNNNEITSQMKFVTNQEKLLKNIACGSGGGKNDLSRYLEVDNLLVPTEQVENMKEICLEESTKLLKQAENCRKNGNIKQAEKLQEISKNYQKLEKKIADSGLTTEEAIRYRLNPRWETIKDITKVSHEAGKQGAKFGVAIGGSISLVSNIIAVISDDKTFSEALLDTSVETAKSAGVGYTVSFGGTYINSLFKQSQYTVVRGIAKANLPTAIISICLSTGTAIKDYTKGKIDEEQLFHQIGMNTTAMLSSSMFTLVGQAVIPIPILGALVGGTVGYILTNIFYQGFVEALKSNKLSAERRKLAEIQCRVAKLLSDKYAQEYEKVFTQKAAELKTESLYLYEALNNMNISPDDLCRSVNKFGRVFGKELSINNMLEFECAMDSNNPLRI